MNDRLAVLAVVPAMFLANQKKRSIKAIGFSPCGRGRLFNGVDQFHSGLDLLGLKRKLNEVQTPSQELALLRCSVERSLGCPGSD